MVKQTYSVEMPDMAYNEHNPEKKGKSKCCCTSILSLTLLLLFGSFGIISGAVLMPMVYDMIIKGIVYDMMVLTPDSLLYPEWVEPSLPLTSNFYFFEIKNPTEIEAGGKPELVERGPYSYTLYVRRDNVTVNGNGTISSIPVYSFHFDRENSAGPDTDRFLQVNMPMTSTSYMMRDSPNFIKESTSQVLDSLNETMFVELSVKEVLWGYYQPLFGLIDDIFPIPGSSDQFGFLLGYNNSHANGLFTVYDGTEDVNTLNRFDNWNGKTELDYWHTPEANMMNGTDGMMWSPFIDDVDELLLFHPDFCRTIPYVFTENEKFKGVPLRRFELAPYAYANGTIHPPNAGFCDGETCAPTGIQRIDACNTGSPMGMSNPHFLDADPWLAEQVIGMKPEEEKHRNFFLLEPIMGMPYVMKQRLQISMYIEQVDGFPQTGNVSTMYLPALWFSQEVAVPDTVIDTYKLGFQLTENLMSGIGYVMIAIGALMVVLASIGLIFKFIGRNSVTKDDDNFDTISYKQTEPVAFTNETFESHDSNQDG